MHIRAHMNIRHMLAAKKSNTVVGCIRQTIECRLREVVLPPFLVLVRAQLELNEMLSSTRGF